MAVAAPLMLAAAHASGYYAILPVREASWPWFKATFNAWAAGEWWLLAWASAEFCTVCIVTAVAAWGVGRLARAVQMTAAFDGFWLANPVTAMVGLLLFAAVEPAMRSDLEHWGGATWLTCVVIVLPVYAWCFHSGAAGGRTRR